MTSPSLGNKRPHFQELHFKKDALKLELRLKAAEEESNGKVKTRKIIDLKGNQAKFVMAHLIFRERF